jgi:hypothetical protein
VLLFTVLTLVFTLVHIGKFHLDPQNHALYTVVLTWVWIAVYIMVPLLLTVLLVLQLRAPGGDPPRRHPLPLWLRGLLVLQALVMLLVGALLIAMPSTVAPFWPWMMTVPIAHFSGAWLLGLGLAAAHMVWENDYPRVAAALLSMIAFGVLQFIALARFPAAVQWGMPQTWAYLLFLAVILITGLAGSWQARRIVTDTTA